VDAHLTIARTSPDDVKQRQVIIKLDAEPFAVLLYGETVTKTIDPGAHRLVFDNTWSKKKLEFRVEEGEDATFHVTNRAGLLTWWMVAALGAGPMYLSVERVPPAAAAG